MLKIKLESHKKVVTFGSLEIGTVFRVVGSEHAVRMMIRDEDQVKNRAVNLANGQVEDFFDHSEVMELDAELVIHGYAGGQDE